MTDPVELPAIDEAPKSGVWVDSHAPLDDITEEQVAKGEAAGRAPFVGARTQSTAHARAQELKNALMDYGFQQVSVELQPGRSITGIDPWDCRTHFCTFGHHTAIPLSYRNAGRLTPSLSVCKLGRSDVPGPLCNGYMGFDGIPRILTLGPANHPGEGGPLTLAGRTIPQNSARPYAFGWEMEGGDYAWLDWQHDAMARCFAATLDWLGSPRDAHAEHKTWAPSRKIDRFEYTRATAIAAIARVNKEEDDLPTPRDVWVYGIDNYEGKSFKAEDYLASIDRKASETDARLAALEAGQQEILEALKALTP